MPLAIRVLALGAMSSLGCPGAPSGAPAASGAFFVEAPPPAVGEAIPSATSLATIVPQLRPAAARASLFVSPSTLAILDEHETLTLLDLDGTARAVVRHAGTGAISRHGALLATGGVALDLETGASFHLPRGARASPRGDRYALLDGEDLVIGNVESRGELAVVTHAAGRTSELHWLPVGDRLVICGAQSLQLRDAEGALVAIVPGPVVTCAPRPTGGAIARLDPRGVLTLSDPETLDTLAFRAGGAELGNRLAWSDDGLWLATWRHATGRLTLWDASTGQPSELGIGGRIERVAIAPGGRFLALSLSDRTIVLDRDGGLRIVDGGLALPAFDESGQRLALVGPGRAHVLQLSTGLHGPLVSFGHDLPPASAISVGWSRRSSHLLVHAGGATFGWSRRGVEVLDRYDTRDISPAVAHWTFAPRDEHGVRTVDYDRYVMRAVSETGCAVATRVAGGALVVIDAHGAEGPELALDPGEALPCTNPDNPCGLPAAVSKDCSVVAVQRGTLLRTFDGATGRVLARRTMTARGRRPLFSLRASVLADVTWGTLDLLRAPDLAPLLSRRDVHASHAASSADGRAHAFATEDELILATEGAELVRQPLDEPTLGLTYFGQALVRETDELLELRDPTSGAAIARLERRGPSLVVRASTSPPLLAAAHCDDGVLVVVATDRAPLDLGACTDVEGIREAGPRIAVVDAHHASLHDLAGGTLELEHFVTEDEAWLFVVDPAAAQADGVAERTGSLRRRAAGPVLDAALDPVVIDRSLSARLGG